MASPTQTVVGKGIPNPLIVEGLLKILRDLVPFFPPKSLTNSCLQNGRTTKIPVSISQAQTCHVNSKPLTSHFPQSPVESVKLTLNLYDKISQGPTQNLSVVMLTLHL